MKRLTIIIFQLLILQLHFACNSAVSNPEGTLKVTVLGAAGQVSGSMTLVEANTKKFLIDCGLFYTDDSEASYEERQSEAEKRNETLPFNPKELDAVFITHAHLDHVGRIPLLIEKGFHGKIYCTEATREIMQEMLLGQIRYDNRDRDWAYSSAGVKNGFSGDPYVTAHWNACKGQMNIKQSNLVSFHGSRTDAQQKFKIDFSPCRACAYKTLQRIMPLVQVIDFDSAFQFDSKTRITWLYSGHIPGSASILMEVSLKENITKRLLFSGDLGNTLALLQNGPAPAPKVDALWMETTYGDIKRHLDVEAELAKFAHDISEALKNNGIAWIPAFALDRSQKILHEISKAKLNGLIPADIPVYCPSPTAGNITSLYQAELTNQQGWFKPELYFEQDVFPKFIKTLPQDIPRPSILITTSGMMDAAFSVMLSHKLLPDSSVSVFLVGYQDPGTPGGQLKNDQEVIEWEGKSIPVKAHVNNYSAFTAHADAQELEDWLSNQDKNATSVFLVHGSESMLKAQKLNLSSAGFKIVNIPKEGEIFNFSSTSDIHKQ